MSALACLKSLPLCGVPLTQAAQLTSTTACQQCSVLGDADVTIGGWMLAMNVTHLDDRRLCETACGPATLAVYDIPQCAGLCDAPKKLPELHRDPACQTPVLDAKGDIPTLRPFFWFESVRPKKSQS